MRGRTIQGAHRLVDRGSHDGMRELRGRLHAQQLGAGQRRQRILGLVALEARQVSGQPDLGTVAEHSDRLRQRGRLRGDPGQTKRHHASDGFGPDFANPARRCRDRSDAIPRQGDEQRT
jgi:hypothetical protein